MCPSKRRPLPHGHWGLRTLPLPLYLLPYSLPGKCLWSSASRWGNGRRQWTGRLAVTSSPLSVGNCIWNLSQEMHVIIPPAAGSECHNLEDKRKETWKEKLLMWMPCKSWNKGAEYPATSDHVLCPKWSPCLIPKVIQMMQKKIQEIS